MAERDNKKTPPGVRLSPAPWVATAAGFVVLLLGLMAAFAIGIYSGGWHGPMSRWAATLFPFPAAIVDGRPVWVRDVLSDTDAFAAYREAHPEVQGADLTREQIQSNVLSRLVQEAWFEQVAGKRGIVVSDAEVDAEFVAAKQAGADLPGMLKQFDWSEAEFKRRVIRVYLLQQKLHRALGDELYQKEASQVAGQTVYFMKK